ncbi:DUF1707 SHOCT-like domain-containing protein [Salinactinospora qingdaonensis]|uniref:DUF1707 domain-containing protein n=1 Tax=Salinactinospora qingdaonensis TaxID=702744 RepID=A0ABP7FL14_9ACTN
MSEHTPASRLRASDRDRERVMAVLRAAVTDGRLSLPEFEERTERVQRARVLGELPAVTADLVAPHDQPIHLSERPVAALLRDDARAGRWVVRTGQLVVALLGTADVDMRDALFAEGHVRMSVATLLGRVRVRVPEGVDVRVRGWSFLGRRSTSTRPVRSGAAPTLEIGGFSLLGSLRVIGPGQGRRRQPLRRSRP